MVVKQETTAQGANLTLATRQHIETHLARLFAYALSLTNDRNEAQDLVQDSVVKALGARGAPKEEVGFRLWMFRVLRNTHIDRIRHNGQEVALFDSDIGLHESIEKYQPWRYEDSLINVITVRNGLARLNPEQREIISLVDIFGFKYRETAEVLGVPAGTVMSRLARARQALLDVISGDNVHVLPKKELRQAK